MLIGAMALTHTRLVDRDASTGDGLPTDGIHRVRLVAKSWQTRYSLCNAEFDVLLRAALGEDRDAIAERRASSPLTVRAHVAGILKKTRDASLHHAVGRLLRAALNIE
jgi:DNA-binding CsgD family transcriptional regulator